MDLVLPFAVIGVIVCLSLLVCFLSKVYTYFLSNYSYSNYKDSWAVVTGASAGIGASFAHRLASRGVNVVLMARSKDKLDQLAKHLSDTYKVKTLVHTFDFATACKIEYEALRCCITPLEPTILINNVGVNVEFPTEFLDMDIDDISRIVNVNINSTNQMTKLILPFMKSKSKGIIMCLSSGGGVLTPAPLITPYSATKSYNDVFAHSLSGEVPSGVHVHSLTPFFVESAMAKMRSSFTVPSSDTFAECALRQVGNGVRLQPYWVHWVMASVVNLAPKSLQIKYVANLHRSIRVRALKKKERMAKQN